MSDADEPRPRARPGPKPKPDEEKQVNAGVYATRDDIAYLLTWNPCNTSYAFREMVEELRKTRPGGRHSAPRPDPACKLRPGTKTSLKREIAALKKQLRAAGLTPVTDTETKEKK